MDVYDLVCIGTGPAGLNAMVSAASEGIKTLGVERSERIGGQAVTSTLIENYFGFRGGITGRDLMMAGVDQAVSFGAQFKGPFDAHNITREGDLFVVSDDEGVTIPTRCIVLTCGVKYRTLDVNNLPVYLGRGVSYGSPSLDAGYRDQQIYVVGGANSAGQAAAHLSKCEGCTVHLLVRSDSIEKGMSEYLIRRLASKPNVQIHLNTEVVGVHGDGRLQALDIITDGDIRMVDADQLFILVGAKPSRVWLDDGIQCDPHGFVLAGRDLPEEVAKMFMQDQGRPPFNFETSIPGVFVAGDLRSGSSKRIAVASGEGAHAVSEIHHVLAA